jgi:hypothetical protein
MSYYPDIPVGKSKDADIKTAIRREGIAHEDMGLTVLRARWHGVCLVEKYHALAYLDPHRLSGYEKRTRQHFIFLEAKFGWLWPMRKSSRYGSY